MSVDALPSMIYSLLYAIAELTIILIAATIIAELILEYVDLTRVAHVLSTKNRVCGMVLSVLFGLITPFCPCATVPVTVGMNDAKLPFCVTMCFLFSSPVLSFAILGGIVSIFNVKVALLYLLFVSLASIITGLIMESLGMAKFVRKVRVEGGGRNLCTKEAGLSPLYRFILRFKRATIRGMVSSKRIIPYIILGCAIGIFLDFIFTERFITQYILPYDSISVIAVTLFGIPLSIDSAAAISLCGLLRSKGIPTGTILAFLTGSIGASVPMFMLLSSIYRIQLIAMYVVIIFFNIVTIGYLFNMMGL